MRHEAFLSHNQAIDFELASALEDALQRFAKPTFKRKAISVFRDASDLSATPNLWGKLEQTLAETEFFIWMASSGSARSKWCRKETEFWRDNKSMDNFLIVLTEGTLEWDDEKGDYDYERSTAIPDTLAGQFKNEPLFVDLREIRESPDLDLKNVNFKQKVAMIAATLHGKSVSDMIGEEIRVHRRNLRIRNIATTALILLTIAAITGGVVAEAKRREAVYKTKIALNATHRAFAQVNRETDPTLAYRLAEHAYLTAVKEELPVAEARTTLVQAYYSGPFAQEPGESVVPAEKNFREEMVVDGQNLKLEVGDEVIVAKNPQDQVLYQFVIPEPGTVKRATFTGDGKYVLGIGEEYLFSYTMAGRLISATEPQGDYLSRVTDIHPTGSSFLDVALEFVAVSHPKGEDDWPKTLLSLEGHKDWVLDAQFSPDGTWIVSHSRDEEARIWSLSEGPGDLIKTIRQKGMRSVVPVVGERAVLVTDRAGTDRKYLLDDARQPYFGFDQTGGMSYLMSESPYRGVGHSYKLEAIKLEDGNKKFGIMTTEDGAVIAEFDTESKDETFEQLGYTVGPTGILNEAGDALFTMRWTNPEEPPEMHFSSDGKYVLVWFFRQGIRIYPIDPEVILAIMNRDRRFGDIWELDAVSREIYLIEPQGR